ncbi:MAG: hypothetical protein LBG75_01845 [Candidatus Nomurabacteria bacterium]|jgi:hypothetical protein|nr:hypothetical protein [Candidatus Nomurabacteria bacterium]
MLYTKESNKRVSTALGKLQKIGIKPMKRSIVDVLDDTPAEKEARSTYGKNCQI